MKGVIYETTVYDGSSKEWRILNINSGTVYSMRYDSEEEASAAIKHEQVRGDRLVKRVSRHHIIWNID